MSNLSVYIHIPFCRRKCNYCDFYSAPPDVGAVSSYVEALCNQIRTSPAAGSPVKTVYIGGGTPSLLSEDEFSMIATALNETFDLTVCEEFTTECNPESVSASLAERWMNCGVNRISMGVQSFCDRHLNRLGRLHTATEAESALAVLRRCGFENISLDLMAALPDQTESELKNDLERLLCLSPQHVSVYLLKIEADSSFGRQGVSEADEELQRRMYLLSDKILADGGYEHYEISNFARPGYRSRHNLNYWQGGEYLGFGPGAAGFYQGVRYRIPPDTKEFCRRNGAVVPETEETVDLHEAAREKVLLGLRLSDGIDLSLIPEKKRPFLRTLCDGGFGRISDGRFSLTAEGFLVSDYLISVLLPDR